MNERTKNTFEVIVTSYGRINDERNKKHSRTSPDVQFKEFSLNEQKTGPSRTMSELRKPFLKKSDEKIFKKKQRIKFNMQHVNKKPLARNGNLVQTEKLGLE